MYDVVRVCMWVIEWLNLIMEIMFIDFVFLYLSYSVYIVMIEEEGGRKGEKERL